MISRNTRIMMIVFAIVFSLSLLASTKKNVMHFIDQAVCNQCGDCVKACTENAIKVTIVNGKKKHEIDQAICTQCGDCIDPCKEGAILVLSKKDGKAAKSK
jgi:ferredoxin